MARRVPVTLLTGALGSGKTTLLRHIVQQKPKDYRICVIQNEASPFVVEDSAYVGGDNPDQALFARYLELPNGCVCCAVRDDFVQALETLTQRDATLDHIVVETSGLADPGPLVSVFWTDDALEGATFLDSVVAVVDTVFLQHTLEVFGSEESVTPLRQIAYADVVVLNKTDLLPPPTAPAQLEAVLQRVRQVNALADVLTAVHSAVAVETVLHRRAYDVQPQPRPMPADSDALPGHLNAHAHPSAIRTVAFEVDSAHGLAAERAMNLWLDDVLFGKAVPGGGEVFRLKAVLAVAGCPARVVYQGVYSIFDSERGTAWRPDEPRRHRLVVIGRGLVEEELKASFIQRVLTTGQQQAP